MAGKCNIVTGGGSGIGLGIAESLARLGSNVVIASRNPERVAQAVEYLTPLSESGGKVIGLQCNIRDRDSCAKMVSDTLAEFGRLDGLVNNGGGQFHSAAENITQNGFHAVVDTNLYGTWNCINEAFHQYMKENGGRIVNIVTINRMGMAGMAHSGAARAAVKNLSQSLGAEWGKYNVVINNVAPGTIYSATAQVLYMIYSNDGSLWDSFMFLQPVPEGR